MQPIRLLTVAALLALPPLHAQQTTGATLFQQSGCSHCHTVDHHGGDIGPNLTDVARHKSSQQIRQQILEGSAAMPAFRTILQPAQIDSLIAFLQAKPLDRAIAPR